MTTARLPARPATSHTVSARTLPKLGKNIVSVPGFTLPGDVSGSDRAYREDIVDPPIRAQRGAIQVPWDRPGLGFDANFERIKERTVRELVLENESAVLHA